MDQYVDRQEWQEVGCDSLCGRQRSTDDCECLSTEWYERKCCIVGNGMWIGESAPLVQTRRLDAQAVNTDEYRIVVVSFFGDDDPLRRL
jgi:hypothetical protein